MARGGSRPQATVESEASRRSVGDKLRDLSPVGLIGNRSPVREFGKALTKYAGRGLERIQDAQARVQNFADVGSMGLGDEPVDLAKMTQAVADVVMLSPGGGGVANLGLLQKSALKKYAASARRHRKHPGLFSPKEFRHRKLRPELIREQVRGIQALPDVVLRNVDYINTNKSGPWNLGSYKYGQRRMNLNPTASKQISAKKGFETPLHEAGGHATFYGFRGLENPILEQNANFRAMMIKNIASEMQRLTKAQRKAFYGVAPHEKHARSIQQLTDNLYGMSRKSSGFTSKDMDEFFTGQYIKKTDKVMDGVRIKTPHLYERTMKKTFNDLNKAYGKGSIHGLRDAGLYIEEAKTFPKKP